MTDNEESTQTGTEPSIPIPPTRPVIKAREVPGKGPIDSPFVVVGEAPGVQEIKQGAPFVGPSGAVFEYALRQFPKESYPEPYVTNVSKTMITFAKDPAALSQLAMDRRPALLEELKGHKRKVILALGSVALQALTGNTAVKITQVRGTIFPSELADVGIVAALHPAYLLRGNGSLRQFKSDIAYAVQLAQGNPPHPWHPPKWTIIESSAELFALINRIRALPAGTFVAADIETTGFRHRSDKILNLSLSFDGNVVYTISGHKTDAQSPNFQWKDPLTGAIFKGGYPNLIHLCHFLFGANPNVRWVWHNGKFDAKFFHHIGQTNCRVDDDTMLMSYALDEQRGIHDLETVSGDWLTSPNWKGTLDQYKKKKSSYDVIPFPILYRYAAYDVANTWRLANLLWGMILLDKKSHLQYTKSLIPASTYLIEIEKAGIAVDEERVAQNRERLEEEAIPYIEDIKRIANNVRPGYYSDKVVNSPKQLAELIFDDLKLKPAKGPNIRSTSADIIEKLPDHPLLQSLRKYRKVQKALSTYVIPYTKDPEKGYIEDDGKVHTTYLIHGTATGRLSSRDPNLQNIPRDPILRGQFVALPGRMFIEPDLNQAELRSLAILSGDPTLCRIYLEGRESLHEVTRRAIFGMPEDWSPTEIIYYLNKFYLTPETRYNPSTGEDELMHEMKMVAKNVNFGIIYGITEAGLSEQTGQAPQDCKVWLESWANAYPVAWKFIQTCRQAPLFGRNLVTVFGYRKRFQVVTPENIVAVQNESANMPHQSTASVITMHGGIRTYRKIREYDAYYINTVHDSLLIDAPLDYEVARTVTSIVTKELTQVPRDWGLTEIPFVADAKWGTRWGSLGDPDKFAKQQGWKEAA